MISRTFAGLANKPVVNAEELIATLKDYAEEGWAINGDVVIDIIKRTALNTAEIAQILAHLKTGKEKQLKVCDTMTSKSFNSWEYEKVSLFIATESLFD